MMRPARSGRAAGWRAIALVASLVAAWPGATAAQAGAGPADLFQEGNRRYQAGDFEGALEAYSSILAAGFDSGDLQYNLGNTHFKLGRLGPAVLAYERARRAMPGDENVLANLDLARSLTADEITPLPGFWLTRLWNWWVELLPRGLLVSVVVVGYLTVMALVIWRILDPAAGRRGARVLVPVFGGITLLFAVNLAIREFGIGRADHGVVMVSETPVQSAPAEDPGLQLFSIHEGTTVRIDRRSDGWLEVVLEDGKVGWLRSSVVEVI